MAEYKIQKQKLKEAVMEVLEYEIEFTVTYFLSAVWIDIQEHDIPKELNAILITFEK